MSQRVTDVMVVERHAVFRQGLVSCLDGFDGIGRVESVASIADAWSHPALGEADVVLLDAMLDGAADFVASVLEFTATRVVALAGKEHLERLATLVDAGAVAALVREDLTAERLALSVRAVAAGATTMLATYPGHVPAAAAVSPAPELTSREQRVLALVADGLPTREIGEELHYSERTVKKVLGDVVVKLGARSRSQAIARAVRQGII
ncbi:MAG TPA: response regulator transcription factor [Solirubrobacteraceae bacterium]|nr:response regulator transcription factor [Solirubrobacteraceae bacterium]